MVVFVYVIDARNWDGRRCDPPSLWRGLFDLQEPGKPDDGRKVRRWSESHSDLLPVHSVSIEFDPSPIGRDVLPSPDGSRSK